LLQAQQKAHELFRAVETQGLIRPNVLETRLNQDIYDLAQQMFGISTYWHKRIVRAGRNTLAPYDENPPDLLVGEDDILFLDWGRYSKSGRPILAGRLSWAPTRLS